ncbi:unnamed protein product [Prunus armeniaca]
MGFGQSSDMQSLQSLPRLRWSTVKGDDQLVQQGVLDTLGGVMLENVAAFHQFVNVSTNSLHFDLEMKEVRDLQQDKQLWTFGKKRSYKRNKEEAIVKGPGTDVVPDEGSLIHKSASVGCTVILAE